MDNKQTIYNIQVLRFFAALIVVIAHSEIVMYGIRMSGLGGIGVDIFFIISGFIMPFIAYGGKKADGPFNISAAKFFLRRLVRILPLYIILTACAVYVSYLVSYQITSPARPLLFWFPSDKIDLVYFFRSITFTHWDKGPILGVGWTLQFEFFFYAIFAIFIAIGVSKIEKIEISFVTIVIVCNILVKNEHAANFIKAYFPPIEVISQPVMIEFALGMFMYRLYISKIFLNAKLATAILICSLPLFYILEKYLITTYVGNLWHRPLIWGAFSFYIVWATISLEGKVKTPNILVYLGNASYCIYLIHGLFTSLLAHRWERLELHLHTSVFMYLAFYVLFSIITGCLVHSLIEKKIAKFTRRFI
ncbi:TPA: acyltransferase family protein [Escherichia coli]